MTTVRIFCAYIAFISWGCNSSSVFLEFQEIHGGWNKNEVLEFKFSKPDNPSKNNIFLYLHTDKEYPFSNLFVVTELTYPNQHVQTDTLEFEMTSLDGSSLGTGWLDVKEHKLWCYENMDLNQEGNYSFRVRQSMRHSNDVEGLESLMGILDVGLGIEPAY